MGKSEKVEKSGKLAARLIRVIFTLLIVEIGILTNFSFMPSSFGKYRWMWLIAILSVYFIIDAIIGGNIRNRLRNLETKYRRVGNWKKSPYRKKALFYLCLHFIIFPGLTWLFVTFNN